MKKDERETLQGGLSQTSMKHTNDMAPDQEMRKRCFTGIFHGKVHSTSGRATVYQRHDARESCGPDVISEKQNSMGPNST